MGNMKYKVGDKVRIKSIDWYNKNKNEYGDIDCGEVPFIDYMTEFCGRIVAISKVRSEYNYYDIEEDNGTNGWTDEMIEGLAEEEMSLDKAGQITDFEYEGLAYTLPDGYIFKDENGNEILTSKIILEKKKKEYPKTYVECCRVLGVSEFEYNHTGTNVWYRHELMATLDKLILCRNTYWEIAGREMGLEKPWEPDWCDYTTKYCIIYSPQYGGICKRQYDGIKRIPAFPTAEMRDAFYENFKDLIEQCKELL